ncbi:MAG: outer membrane protein assembly factor BamE [Planctomycetales bacterium]|nr:outer membrane protein assembly factor BamE [Planctomycetales bacterium]
MLIGVSGYVMNAHEVRESSLKRLAIGMSETQVESILGKPSAVERPADGNTRWRYSGATWCIVSLEYSADGQLSAITHDH